MSRRPLAWLDVIAIGAVIVVTLWSVHPALLVSTSTITGGDTGAHLALPAYLRSLGDPFGLTPWYPGWFAGMPAYTYYFVLPDVLALWASYVINAAVAFKLATILGSLLLPVGAYLMGRLFRAPRPVPAALAMATLPFLFDASFAIDGGNLFSTMAGEYAFSLSLALALVTIGLFARGVRTGRGYWLAALGLAGTLLAHVLPFFWVVVASGVVLVVEWGARRGWVDPHEPRPVGDATRPLRFVVGAGLLGAGLTAWWLLPFATSQAYTDSMGYSNVSVSSLHAIFSALGWYTSTGSPAGDRWVIVAAALGAVVAIVWRDRLGVTLTALTALSLLAFVIDPQSVIWNQRLVPFWFIGIHLLAGWLIGWPLARWVARARGVTRPTGGGTELASQAVAEAGGADLEPLADAARLPADDATDAGVVADDAGIVAPDAVVAEPVADASAPAAVGVTLEESAGTVEEDAGTSEEGAGTSEEGAGPVEGDAPPATSRTFGRAMVASVAVIVLGLASTLPGLIPTTASALGLATGGNQVTSWAQWNYSGYQGKAAWPEYHGLMTTMARVAGRYGCGRAMWEYAPSESRFGTTMALMLLPYWTNNCVDSMEGLFFESSATTPYHFLDQAALSSQPSDPQVGLPYGPLDVPLGVTHLQQLGVRYYIAFSPLAVTEANGDPQLQFVAQTRAWPAPGVRWRIYLVRHSPMVAGLVHTPVVVAGIGGRTAWLAANVRWWTTPNDWSVEATAAGPASWPHVASLSQLPATAALPHEQVTNVRVGLQSLSFHVSRIGVPTLVKVSYYPRWHAQGAEGPYRASPNLMIVVPTSHEVTLVYGTTSANRIGALVSEVTVALGIVVAFFAWRRRRTRRRQPAHG